MKHFAAILLFLQMSSTVLSQGFYFYKDYETLLQSTKKKDDKVNFENLLEKFHRNNELTEYEKIALVVGSTGHIGNGNKELLKFENQIDVLNDKKEYIKAIDLADKCLTIFPLSLKALLGKWRAYSKLGNEKKSDFYSGQALVIFEGMQASGHGEKRTEPVIGISLNNIDEYASKHAAGAGFVFFKSYQDEFGHTIVEYKSDIGNQYFVIPK